MASQQIEARGLTGNLEELEAQGYTVLSPEQMGDPRLIERTTKALLRISEKLTGGHYRIQENFQGRLSEEMLARNNDRFRQLMNYDHTYGWQEKFGPVHYRLRKIWETLSDSEKQAVIIDQM